ncbi:hypothetical protein HG66A1_07130 [Gimesia chilikensis]|uniref:CD-NTase associated protein 4-like DNA endonuclease domain-containing protein n=2 Tax=Gimesia chilikensis TaxID=2605989 RepID=A0A517PHU2_9PLAN|nr:hypothetical protein HG66A1_07130 [Gimesia chilikensis]
MLRVHQESKDDYCILFEVHDDVVLLNHSTNPTEAYFYQVKTKTPGKKSSGTWSLTNLLSRKTDAKEQKLSSILGKLYAQYLRFESYAKKMVFVSDAAFKIELKSEITSTDLELISLKELDDSSLLKIKDILMDEHQLKSEPEGLELFQLERTPLSVPDHQRHTEGIISEFLEKETDGSILPRPFHQALRSEVQIRNNRESIAASPQDMIRHRGISRADLKGMINSAQSIIKQNDLYDTIRSQLEAEKMNFFERNSLMQSVREFFRERLDQTNLLIVDASQKAVQLIQQMDNQIFDGDTPLDSAILYLATLDEKEFDFIRTNYSQDFLNAMFLVLIYEQKPSKTDSEHEEKSS